MVAKCYQLNGLCCVRYLGIYGMAQVGGLVPLSYLRTMKSTRVIALLATSAVLFLTASCSQAPDAEKDPNADAAYKRANRTEMYRKAQASDVTRN
ncbi:hypothetical protein DDQ68_07040 [Hymenobacter nivis]|uniref:Uncharacterized protein n=2 Tax=Hymenobacter nivis TaxID=1850093 RepID=A0A2Z3GG61_9BACT|nr:hypothetical protein DDQ68_07040 [Hymenobacter nivis]